MARRNGVDISGAAACPNAERERRAIEARSTIEALRRAVSPDAVAVLATLETGEAETCHGAYRRLKSEGMGRPRVTRAWQELRSGLVFLVADE